MRRTGGRRAVDFDRHLENLRFKRRRCEEKKGGRKRREPHTGILKVPERLQRLLVGRRPSAHAHPHRGHRGAQRDHVRRRAPTDPNLRPEHAADVSRRRTPPRQPAGLCSQRTAARRRRRHPAAGPRVLFVKRIIGLPGERVRIEAGIVHVDERPLDEPYVVHRAAWVMSEKKLASAFRRGRQSRHADRTARAREPSTGTGSSGGCSGEAHEGGECRLDPARGVRRGRRRGSPGRPSSQAKSSASARGSTRSSIP